MNAGANLPLSEQYRLAAKSWVVLESAANLLEETKSAVLSQMMSKLGDIPVSHAERAVKSSDEWREFITKMVEARGEANMAKVKCEYIKMKFSEQQSSQATRRAEMKL
ncbi:hypothetical protein ABIF26_006406 [Bradyrhizobium elkanii]|uniref:hypothetical protein n=1 Tax=Bradyrhizobium elkanii TaxID=29448 RepID=UPI002167C572|nr:hypothetical protein [Bradyrhizobium elkanii]MCS3690903.1 hypothetical protein [Bradyrhizobium elkanii]